MNRSKLKNYAPQARRDFIQAITDRAAVYGLTLGKIEEVTERGDVALIGGKPFPISVADKRRRLEERVKRHGFDQVMEAMAYTWFNRLVAIRYMEIHGYLDHGYRVLSNADATKSSPEIVEHAEHVDLPGLDRQKVVDLKLEGTKEAELYRMLLLAQCNALHKAMPFLFERIDDETELLLPDNLLHSDSIIRKLVNEIDEADWQPVEIIGWLYQFYISDKKDEVIGKVVKSEDIPAATQLFTPNWIVKYLVQNSLGRQWLATYPQSGLRQKMEFYIEPAEQTPEVQAELKKITPESLNPEELTLMDPACGSAHILVEAYDLLKEIYLERGYRLRDIPKLILTKNLFGLEIDDRAAQLAAFALMMKARADDRRIFDGDAQPNVLAIQESNGLNVNAIVQAFTEKKITGEGDPFAGEFGFMGAVRAPLFATENRATATVDDKLAADFKALFALFEDAKTYGSLIQVPEPLHGRLPNLVAATDSLTTAQSGLAGQRAAEIANRFVGQAVLLAAHYGVVVTNPPYMGHKFYNRNLKSFVESTYPIAKADLYGCFVLRNLRLTRPGGFVAMITIPNWMFLSSFEDFRRQLIDTELLHGLIQNGRGVWGPDFGSCSFVLRRHALPQYCGAYRRLFTKQGSVPSAEQLQARFFTARTYHVPQDDLHAIPGSPIAFWITKKERELYRRGETLGAVAEPRKGLDTGENARFLRLWHEVPFDHIDVTGDRRDTARWFPYNKGGEYQRWYGNREHVIDWGHGGSAIKSRLNWTKKKPTIRNEGYYFKEGYTWTTVSIGGFSARYTPPGSLFDNGGCTLFDGERLHWYGALLNSVVADRYFEFLSPTLNFQPGDIGRLLCIDTSRRSEVEQNARLLMQLAREQWDASEVSWEFNSAHMRSGSSLREATEGIIEAARKRFQRALGLEQANNAVFIEAYGLGDELDAAVNPDRLTFSQPEPSGVVASVMGGVGPVRWFTRSFCAA